MAIDLTPFGFTPTESLAFDALLVLGPSSGYAIAKEIGVARANAYQALNGLVGKGAAALIDENPQRFRAVKPEALLTRIAAEEADKLAALERQVRERGGSGDDAIVSIEGERALIEVLTRWAGRSAGAVRCVAPQPLLDALQPVWRKRESDGSPTELRAGDTVLFWSEEAAVIAHAERGGHWFSDPAIRQTVALALDQLTS